jgi:hypothetical protein
LSRVRHNFIRVFEIHLAHYRVPLPLLKVRAETLQGGSRRSFTWKKRCGYQPIRANELRSRLRLPKPMQRYFAGVDAVDAIERGLSQTLGEAKGRSARCTTPTDHSAHLKVANPWKIMARGCAHRFGLGIGRS